MAVTTIGRQIVRGVLPQKYKNYADGELNKGTIQKLTTAMAKQDPDAYINILQDLNKIGQRVVSVYGKDTTITLDDLDTGAQVRNASNKLKQLISNVVNSDDLTQQQKQQKIIDLGYKYTEKLRQVAVDDAQKRKTGIANQIKSGSRGNAVQLMQLVIGDMMMKDAANRDIPYLAMASYADGDSPMSYWASAMSGRKSTYDVQAATGKVGYLGKQATNITHNTPIAVYDCGTKNTGVPVKAQSTDNVGALLLRPWHNHPAGSVVTQKMVAQAGPDDQMVIRSPITCKAHNGVCALCSGIQQNGKLPVIGSYVAMNAAKTFIQPLTQSGISSKHGSGIGGKKVEDPDGEDQPTGFQSIQRMLLAPKVFPGGAVLAPADGRVSDIRQAPQGGWFVTVNQNTTYVPIARKITVKPGDVVQAGDTLTNGVPNPMQIVKYKGIGQGRRYFTSKLNQLLPKAGAGTLRRNLQQFSRAMINKVKITNDQGFGGYYPGDIVDYDDIAQKWKPRDDSKELPVDKASNTYLQQPTLYYSIGTRVTPNVIKNLKKYDIKTVTTNQNPPPFEPQFVRSKQVLSNDKHWLPRLAGERLTDSLFDAAQRGITDQYGSSSFVDKIIVDPYKPTAQTK